MTNSVSLQVLLLQVKLTSLPSLNVSFLRTVAKDKRKTHLKQITDELTNQKTGKAKQGNYQYYVTLVK